MKIRQAVPSDLDTLVIHGYRFWEMTKYHADGVPYDAPTTAAICKDLMGEGPGFILVLDDGEEVIGFILIAVTPLIFNPSYQSAMELAYYIEPKYRRTKLGCALLERAEEVCRDRGCEYLSMISMESCFPRQAEAIYERLGYTRTETTYTKEL